MKEKNKKAKNSEQKSDRADDQDLYRADRGSDSWYRALLSGSGQQFQKRCNY